VKRWTPQLGLFHCRCGRAGLAAFWVAAPDVFLPHLHHRFDGLPSVLFGVDGCNCGGSRADVPVSGHRMNIVGSLPRLLALCGRLVPPLGCRFFLCWTPNRSLPKGVCALCRRARGTISRILADHSIDIWLLSAAAGRCWAGMASADSPGPVELTQLPKQQSLTLA